MNSNKKGAIMGIAVLMALLLVILPIILVGGLFTIIVAYLNPASVGMEQDDLHYQALQEVSAEYEPENDIDVYLIKVIDLFSHDKITEDKGQIKDFIETYFLLEKEREVEVTETVDGEEVTRTETETYYVYKTFYEIVSTVREAPFNFQDGAIASIVNLSMAGFTTGGSDDSSGGSPGQSGGTLFGKYPAPVQNGVITCGYGGRINPVTGKAEFHNALDIQGAWHSPITTIADGVVVSTSTAIGPYGNYVVIKHELPEETFYSKYAHLSQILVSPGQSVKQGDTIGIEGGNPTDPNPGYSTGHHVHLEIWTSEGHVNPADYIY
ncbi:M23 family metallopeptidase [Marasmitruncus massiliensis]|uniref:M23 family metallopeptidase n=1 Tax=Marasmitruncus massiliensis TaxID=1944642 RepID=UPI000C7A6CBA|nr:M23 family metallopeptidase [Marasmitruncus massiliensis]